MCCSAGAVNSSGAHGIPLSLPQRLVVGPLRHRQARRLERLTGELPTGTVDAGDDTARVADAAQTEQASERDERRRDSDPDVERVDRRGLDGMGNVRTDARRIAVRERLLACLGDG